MQYTLSTQGTPDIAAIERAIAELDPAMVVDFDQAASALRISSVATEAELLACLRQAGVGGAQDQLVRVPSECCGGCGG
ncbi:hypothetical protein DT603_01035 [Pseudoxanthomonas gei]|uniref:HMA domain-containing protein n=1 Tax=Pseudoxanthomonas gei TaxID=1383030 RepID=A0ABX0A7F8_9GAMM|nr:hypothetical protein [Pseudoxanthomonas gei]NDK37431.1 hypothetical protein [Pseudoxanthomonas gei]